MEQRKREDFVLRSIDVSNTMKALKGVIRHTVGGGELVLDERFFPVVITTWFGEIRSATIEYCYRWLDQMLARARDEGSKLVVVVDVLEVLRPSAVLREGFVHETNARADALERSHACTIVAARGPVMLGSISAVVWMLRGGIRVTTARDVPQALERGLRRLDALGMPRPPGLEPRRYERPQRSGAGAA
ncbi:MAG: hypothetical protein KC501_19300 [Myxococcales bacterium]|nr:hypothetical protein [Myxococcales bacterium]